eukprot:Skav207230  [mRNA]  locus=scaffold1717:149237:171216:+ [translate_table: standard]
MIGRTPLLQHCLFLLSCEGVDLGVQRGSERVLCSLADRLHAQRQLQDADSAADRDWTKLKREGQELLHLTFTCTIQALRRMLKAPAEDVFRTALRVLAHYISLRTWTTKGSNAAAASGSSAQALLHRDLLPLLATVKGDDGGGSDPWGSRGTSGMEREPWEAANQQFKELAESGALTSTTLTHFVLPLALQAILQYGASNAAFDPNYAETGVKCLGECMHGVSWSTCLQTVRQMAFLLSKYDNRDRWIVRGACECLQRFPLPYQELPSPDLLDGLGGMKLPDVLDAFPDKRRRKGKGKGHKGKGKGKGRGKGRSKGKGKGKGRGKGKRSARNKSEAERENLENEAGELDSEAEDKAEEKEEKEDKEDRSDKVQLEEDLEEVEEEPLAEKKESANSVVKSLRSTVLPILRPLDAVDSWDGLSVGKMWQDKGATKSGKGRAQKSTTVRIAVISVMMHCLRHLPPDDFASELPRILGYVVVGLKDRDAESRRASRHALQSVSSSLGPSWFPWIVRELRSRLDRGFMVPVRGAAILAALQALTASGTLKSGDLDSSLQELLTESMEELERQMASKEAETGASDGPECEPSASVGPWEVKTSPCCGPDKSQRPRSRRPWALELVGCLTHIFGMATGTTGTSEVWRVPKSLGEHGCAREISHLRLANSGSLGSAPRLLRVGPPVAEPWHTSDRCQGPDFMLLAGQFSSAPKVLELIWALDRKLTGESLNDKSDLLPRGPKGQGAQGVRTGVNHGQ